jgi:hypothetical protein
LSGPLQLERLTEQMQRLRLVRSAARLDGLLVGAARRELSYSDYELLAAELSDRHSWSGRLLESSLLPARGILRPDARRRASRFSILFDEASSSDLFASSAMGLDSTSEGLLLSDRSAFARDPRKNKNADHLWSAFCFSGGADGARTRDLRRDRPAF